MLSTVSGDISLYTRNYDLSILCQFLGEVSTSTDISGKLVDILIIMISIHSALFFHTELGFVFSPPSLITKEVSFINGEPLRINTSIPIARIHGNLISNPNTTLRLRVFYNGELLQTKPSQDVQRPSEVLHTVTPMPEERAILVMLKLPRPTPDDEGVYEMQLFVDLSRHSPRACLEYVDFVRTSDGLNVPNVLVGSATLHVHQQGK